MSCDRARLLLSVDFAGDGDGGLAEDVLDLCFAQARSVVLKGEMLLGFVKAESPQTVGIGKFAEAAELVFRQRGLQFVGYVHERHAGIIPATANWVPLPSSGP